MFSIFTNPTRQRGQNKHKSRKLRSIEQLERREVFSADPLPVLLVIADQRDFYYREYNETRLALEAEGLDVVVAATTTNTSLPHPGSGQLDQSGAVTPDIALSNADASDYSAIVFVGGWGSSMYQYAYNDPNLDGVTDNYYADAHYNGDADLYDGQMDPTKAAVNELINDFVVQDKYVTAICHGVTVLAWARVDGVSPIAGKHVAVPTTVSAPDQFYSGQWHTGGYYTGQYDQVIANGALASPSSGSIGNPSTVADDVIVDGRIITAENFDSAYAFGLTIAQELLASSMPPINHEPVIGDAVWDLAMNAPAGTVVGQVMAVDPDAGQSLTYSIIAGNDDQALSIDAMGVVRVNNPGASVFGQPLTFTATVQATDNGSPALSDTAQITIRLQKLASPVASLVSGDLVVNGTDGADTIYLWSGRNSQSVYVWMNGVQHGMFNVAPGGHVRVYSGAGDDQVYATDVRQVSTVIYGSDGHDLITGGNAGDLLDGGEGVDRLWGGPGDDTIRGGNGNDYIFGREGNDVLLGGAGDDFLDGFDGRDILIGGAGQDQARGGAGEDLLIGGSTTYDNDTAALALLMTMWISPGPVAARAATIPSTAILDDGAVDKLFGEDDDDWMFAGAGDWQMA